MKCHVMQSVGGCPKHSLYHNNHAQMIAHAATLWLLLREDTIDPQEIYCNGEEESVH